MHSSLSGQGIPIRLSGKKDLLTLRDVSLDVDPIFVLARLREIPCGLPPQPELGIGPTCLLQPQSTEGMMVGGVMEG